MKIIDNPMNGLIVLQPKVFLDNRGQFFESYKRTKYLELGIKDDFVQDNISRSEKNVLRGMHFQILNPQAQLVTVIKGRIYDVCVDIRQESPTYTRWYATELSDGGVNQIYMTPGFAHGFLCLSEVADIHYKVSTIYDFNDEAGFLYNDPNISIDWPVSYDLKISQKDRNLPLFKDSGILE